MTFQIILVAHVLLALGLVGLILIQHGKGADAGAAFGSGAAGSVFGARGAHSFLIQTNSSHSNWVFLLLVLVLHILQQPNELLQTLGKALCLKIL